MASCDASDPFSPGRELKIGRISELRRRMVLSEESTGELASAPSGASSENESKVDFALSSSLLTKAALCSRNLDTLGLPNGLLSGEGRAAGWLAIISIADWLLPRRPSHAPRKVATRNHTNLSDKLDKGFQLGNTPNAAQ
jgi:hypothetical protein